MKVTSHEIPHKTVMKTLMQTGDYVIFMRVAATDFPS
jgi:hypothetical protein